MPKNKTAARKSTAAPLALLIGTRKGAFILHGDKAREKWKLSDGMFVGNIINHIVMDPRDRQTILLCARTGHLGPTIFRSTDMGKSWKEASKPPAFPKAPEGQKGLVLDHNFWLAPGHPSEPRVWYVGTSPPALFRSEDDGDTWEGVKGINEHPKYGPPLEDQQGPPDGSTLHSIM
ncbi:MAG: exo-alpha-sialidase, partial [Chloroflexi bacterium]|nr:exo-alpha-sialidase [Chloroflexota bacterium]